MSLEWTTEAEIASQPAVWRMWSNELPKIAEDTRRWIARSCPDEIWLCGAGTSAFVGEAISVAVDGMIMGIPVRAVPSTDLVMRPFDYARTGRRPLVVSFGRSGNSSESVGTLDVLDRLKPNADRLNITCNADSALAEISPKGSGEQRLIVLPEECHDQGFAMTLSYTTMLLTALACLGDCPVDRISGRMNRLANAADELLARKMAFPMPERAVFLGSGPLCGIAREAALKVLELTAGQVVTSWDSILGFRHGPKSIVNDRTTIFVFASSDELPRKYSDDLISEMRRQYPRTSLIPIGQNMPGRAPVALEVNGTGHDVWDASLHVVVPQLVAVSWSKALSLNVDNPFAEHGNLTRVVSNVKLYA